MYVCIYEYVCVLCVSVHECLCQKFVGNQCFIKIIKQRKTQVSSLQIIKKERKNKKDTTKQTYTLN